MGLSKKATSNGIKQMQNYGTTARHFAMSLAIKKGRPIQVGDTVKRKTDGKEFHVADVSPYGLTLEGETELFNPVGFEVVTTQKHR